MAGGREAYPSEPPLVITYNSKTQCRIPLANNELCFVAHEIFLFKETKLTTHEFQTEMRKLVLI